MNASIIDPLQGDFPEVIEEYLEHGIMKCISFNRRGTLLAAGCSDGSCVVWDFETRGIAKELRDKDCVAAITSVCWSKNGHHILVSAADKSLSLWDVVKGEKISRTILQQTPLQARLHPGGGSSESTPCLVCPFSSAPMIVDLRSEATTTLPISLCDRGSGVGPPSRHKFSDGSANFTPTAACFNKYGDLVYVGNSVGEILIIDHKNNQVLGVVPISGGAVIKNIVFSRDGRYLLTNSSDRTIRIYENLLPLKDSLKVLHEANETPNEVETLKAAGLKCLSLFREFQDSITRVHWKAPCFSGDGEWVVGGSASKGEHKIYIWDRAGHLVKVLEGPKEALMDLAWHPVHPIAVSVSLPGLVYISPGQVLSFEAAMEDKRGRQFDFQRRSLPLKPQGRPSRTHGQSSSPAVRKPPMDKGKGKVAKDVSRAHRKRSHSPDEVEEPLVRRILKGDKGKAPLTFMDLGPADRTDFEKMLDNHALDVTSLVTKKQKEDILTMTGDDLADLTVAHTTMAALGASKLSMECKSIKGEGKEILAAREALEISRAKVSSLKSETGRLESELKKMAEDFSRAQDALDKKEVSLTEAGKELDALRKQLRKASKDREADQKVIVELRAAVVNLKADVVVGDTKLRAAYKEADEQCVDILTHIVEKYHDSLHFASQQAKERLVKEKRDGGSAHGGGHVE